jgi:hypothetical protein
VAFKFLNRPEAKQRVLRIDLARTSISAKDKKDVERAIVVTAESDRLTYFWNDKSGDWSFHTRPHSPLTVLAVAPEQTLDVPWSRRNGVAADGDLAAIAYKRELDKDGSAGLFLDVLACSDADARWNFLTEESPIAIPLAPPCVGVGIDVWAWLTGADLNIVVQTWAGKSGPEGPLPPDLDHLPGFGFGGLPLSPPTPRLTLIQTTIDPGDLSVLAEQDAWKLTDLDEGGFDLDARFDNEQIWVVHRRNAASMSFPFEPTGNSAGVWMLDEAGLGNDPIDLLESQLVANMPPTVLVSCDPSSAKAKVEAEDLPSVEHPQLQRIDPLIVTGDRLRFVEISANREDKQWRLRPRVQRVDKVAIWRGAADWRMERIGPIEHAFWPLNLGVLAPCQWMVDVRDGRIAFATLLPPKPVYLWRYEVTSKGIEMTFGREDRLIGGIACHRFLATPDLLTGEFEWTGMSVLDIDHEQIVLDAAGESAFPAENTQFNGLMSGSTDREAGGTLEYFFPTVNTLGGLLVAHQDAGHGLCGYVGMGDGGGRVIFDSKVDPIEPTTTDTFKSLPPEVVTGPGGAGRAWITLEAADFVAGQLPGYPVPYSDVMRTLAPPENGVVFTLVFLPAERLLLHFTPRSLGGGLQPLIDVLPIADALGNPEANASLDDLAPPTFDLVEDQADAIQLSLGASLPASDPIRSDDTQPFPVQFTISPRLIQAGSPIIFRAQLSDPAITASAFTWTFTSPLPMFPPGDLSGAEVTLTFPFAGQWSVRLHVDAADGRRTDITRDLDVTPSLWSTVWSVYRELNMEGLRLGTTTLELMRHRIEFRIDADGTRQSVHVDYLPEHGSAFRFDAGAEAQQGRTMLRLPVVVSSVDGSFTGLVGAAVRLRRADIRLNVERPFTLGVVTSDRRSFDVLRRETYAELDSTEDQEVTPEEADVETVRKLFFSPGRAADMTPNALAAKPVGAATVSLNSRDDVQVQVELTPLASVISFLIGFVIALNLIALVAGPLLAVLLVALGPAAIVAVGIGSLAALVALAISAGLGWLFIQLAQAAVNWVANEIARDQLSSQETLATIGEALDEAGVMNYAGEGLAEAIAIKAIKEAIADGHGVEPPTHEQPDPNNPGNMRAPSGRERFRPQFFETVVVGPGVCRILLRVP